MLAKNPSALVFLAAVAIFAGLTEQTHAQSNFYQGKTIAVIVGSAPGGLYDLSLIHI